MHRMLTNALRAVCCKNRIRVCKIEKSDFLKICQNKGFGELALKIRQVQNSDRINSDRLIRVGSTRIDPDQPGST